MIRVRTLVATLLAVAVIGAAAATAVAAREAQAPSQQTNLLHNPGIEGPYVVSQVHLQDGQFRDNIFTPEGWVTWWRTGGGEGGEWGQPEVQVISADHPNYGYDSELPRIHTGNQSLKFFTMYRPHDGGLYQHVAGLQPGSTVQFSAWAHAWSCNSHDHIGYTCVEPEAQIHLQVGIEPNGYCDPFSPSVIWGPEYPGQIAPDQWAVIGPVSARVGSGGAVCVFTRSWAKWGWAHLDSYWDDHSLVVTAVVRRPTSTPAPTATPHNTPTPRPDGSIVHVVESGETLAVISRMYGLDVETVRGLNAGSLGDEGVVEIGQEIVIAPPVATPTPEPTLSICVAAYNDRDGDDSWDDGAEELLPGARFALSDGSSVLGEYTSDGLSEPYCFERLTPGTYTVAHQPPEGYEPSGPQESEVVESGGQGDTVVSVAFGSNRGVGRAMTEPSPTETPIAVAEVPSGDASSGGTVDSSDGNGEESAAQIVLAAVSEFSGILVLCLAAGMGLLFYIDRRKS
jgi:LysM repeat protein